MRALPSKHLLIPALLIGLAVLGQHAAWSQENAPPPSTALITSVQFDAAGNLLLEINGEGFDPLVRLEQATPDGMTDIVLQADHVALAPAVLQTETQFAREASQRIPAIAAVHFINEPTGVRIVLDSWQRLQPQLRGNTGRLITIGFTGNRGLPPDVFAERERQAKLAEEKQAALQRQQLAEAAKAEQVRQVALRQKATAEQAERDRQNMLRKVTEAAREEKVRREALQKQQDALKAEQTRQAALRQQQEAEKAEKTHQEALRKQEEATKAEQARQETLKKQQEAELARQETLRKQQEAAKVQAAKLEADRAAARRKQQEETAKAEAEKQALRYEQQEAAAKAQAEEAARQSKAKTAARLEAPRNAQVESQIEARRAEALQKLALQPTLPAPPRFKGTSASPKMTITSSANTAWDPGYRNLSVSKPNDSATMDSVELDLSPAPTPSTAPKVTPAPVARKHETITFSSQQFNQNASTPKSVPAPAFLAKDQRVATNTPHGPAETRNDRLNKLASQVIGESNNGMAWLANANDGPPEGKPVENTQITESMPVGEGTDDDAPAEPFRLKATPPGYRLSDENADTEPSDSRHLYSRPPANTNLYGLLSNPQSAPALRQAWQEALAGDPAKAETTLRRHLETSPADPLARTLLGEILLMPVTENLAAAPDAAGINQNRREMARQELLKAVGPTPVLTAYLSLAELYLADGNLEDAGRLLDKVSTLYPDEPGVLLEHASLSELQNDLPTARNFYNRALSLAPANIELHYRLARLEIKENHLDAARWELLQGLQWGPDDARLWKLLGFIAQKQNHPLQSRQAYQMAAQPDVLINLGRQLEAQNQPAKALALYDTAADLSADDSEILYNLGLIYTNMHQKDRTTHALSRFLELEKDPQDARVIKAKATLSQLGVKSKSAATRNRILPY